MNQKTKDFLQELVDVCIDHGARVDLKQQAFASAEATVDRKHALKLNLKELSRAIAKAENGITHPQPTLVFRKKGLNAPSEWLTSPNGKSWSRDKAKAHVFTLSLREYMDLISEIEDMDRKYQYLFGHESAGPEHTAAPEPARKKKR
ncbi:MAG TPA: hypothetical protein PLN52_25280 [Opitutaceae bacterium]|nr:hypothetical protein [Opitutaceae bacterium]